ncbi:hypothetical protein QR721_05250 [Aciduricibacillus chroicocephali]|uniref:HPr family phosphocarrier protein n=1 Tax=Aciduricibacillus chroicocephali TaxID=3054939 RepID=A0ABY9KY83_9BACI|nr:hypothetical protein QR721_05250 [Bacillaceae bacterium 44XB]
MQEIASHTIKIQKKLMTKDLLEIHTFAIHRDINIFLYHQEAMADARDLPKLLSFFMIDPHDEVLLIIEGNHAEQVYPKLIPLFSESKQIA